MASRLVQLLERADEQAHEDEHPDERHDGDHGDGQPGGALF